MTAGTHADDIANTVASVLGSRDRVSASLGMELMEVREGFARLRLCVRENMLNGHDIVHGGILFVLADTALAYAANSRNTVTVTQQASIIFLSPAKLGETIIAEAAERNLIGRNGTYDVDVTAEDGRTLAVLHGLTRALAATVVSK
jgi:acyl-CoA thioesterase